MLQSSLCTYSEACILANRTIIITGGPEHVSDANKQFDKRSKGIIFKNCAPFRDCISLKIK